LILSSSFIGLHLCRIFLYPEINLQILPDFKGNFNIAIFFLIL